MDANLLYRETESLIKLNTIAWLGEDVVLALEVLLPRVMAESTRIGVVDHASISGGVSLVVGAKVAWDLRTGYIGRCNLFCIIKWLCWPGAEPGKIATVPFSKTLRVIVASINLTSIIISC